MIEKINIQTKYKGTHYIDDYYNVVMFKQR